MMRASTKLNLGMMVVAGLLTMTSVVHAQPDSKVIRVSKNSDAAQTGVHYTTIQAAIDSLDPGPVTDPVVILIFPGVYDENVTLDHSNVSLMGTSKGTVIIDPSSGVPLTISTTETSSYAVSVDSLVFKGEASIAVDLDAWDESFGYGSLRFNNCFLTSTGGAALLNDGAEGVLITECTLSGQDVVIDSNVTPTGELLNISNSVIELLPHATNNSYALSIADGAFMLDEVHFTSSGSTTGEIRGFDVSGADAHLLKAVSFDDTYDSAFDSADPALIAVSYSENDSFVWGDTVDILDSGKFLWQSAWADSSAYKSNDVVENDGSSYVCILEHTSNAANDEPGSGTSWSTYWEIMASKGDTGDQGPAGDNGLNWRGDWSASPNPVYAVNDAVLYNGSSWICLTASTSETPSDSATDWDKLVQGGGTDVSGTGTDSIKIGNSATSSATQSIAVGYSASSTAGYGVALGPSASVADIEGIAIGRSATVDATSDHSIAIGKSAAASDDNSIAIGNAPVASGWISTAIGSQATATEDETVAIGRLASAAGFRGVAIGRSASAATYKSIAIGDGAEVPTYSYGVSIGAGASSGSSEGVAIGNGATSTSTDNFQIAIGSGASSDGVGAIAMGWHSVAGADYAVAIGYDSDASYEDSTAIGVEATTTADNQIRLGRAADYVSVPGRIDVSKHIVLVDTTAPSAVTGASLLYSDTGELYAKDASGNATQLSSHADPRRVDPTATTSFDDRNVVLPFSIHHSNDLVGKEAIIDFTKLVAWAEDKMTDELGEKAGRLVYVKDLPIEQIQTVSAYETEAVMKQLERMPWIEVPLINGNQLPIECWEEVEITKVVYRDELQTQEVINWETLQVETIEKAVQVRDEVGTGKFRRQLKDGWKFKDGKLYRRPTVDDLDWQRDLSSRSGSLSDDENVPAIDMNPGSDALPQWILDRLPQD